MGLKAPSSNGPSIQAQHRLSRGRERPVRLRTACRDDAGSIIAWFGDACANVSQGPLELPFGDDDDGVAVVCRLAHQRYVCQPVQIPRPPCSRYIAHCIEPPWLTNPSQGSWLLRCQPKRVSKLPEGVKYLGGCPNNVHGGVHEGVFGPIRNLVPCSGVSVTSHL